MEADRNKRLQQELEFLSTSKKDDKEVKHRMYIASGEVAA